MSKIAAYLRVSTDDQTAENQKLKIEAWRQGQGLQEGSIDYHIEEGRSGADDRRPVLEQLLDQVRAGVYKRVVVVAFDRWFRSLEHFVAIWNEFKALGVDLISLREPLPAAGPFADFMAKLFSLLGELELDFNRARTRDGMTRKKKQGGHVSRPYLFLQWQRVNGEDQGPAGRWVVYRHEPRAPGMKGGRWRNRRLDFWIRPGDQLELDYDESRDAKALRFECGQGTINRLRKCLTVLEDAGELVTYQRPGSRIRWGRPIGGGPEGVLFFDEKRWRPIAVPIGPVVGKEKELN